MAFNNLQGFQPNKCPLSLKKGKERQAQQLSGRGYSGHPRQ